MLTRASFESFKALKHVDVELSPFTLLVGKNGAGKTSVLEGIHDASQITVRRDREDDHRAGRLGLVFSGTRDPRRIATSPGRGPMRIALTADDGRTLMVEASLPQAKEEQEDEEDGCRFTVTLTDHAQSSLTLPDDGLQRARAFLSRPDVRRFGSAVLLRLDATAMAMPSVTDSDQPRVEHDGAGLASVLNYFAGAEPAILSEIAAELGTVVPTVRGIRTFPTPVMRQREERIVIGDQAVNRTLKEEVPGHRFSLDMAMAALSRPTC
jgi:predicted ATPase